MLAALSFVVGAGASTVTVTENNLLTTIVHSVAAAISFALTIAALFFGWQHAHFAATASSPVGEPEVSSRDSTRVPGVPSAETAPSVPCEESSESTGLQRFVHGDALAKFYLFDRLFLRQLRQLLDVTGLNAGTGASKATIALNLAYMAPVSIDRLEAIVHTASRYNGQLDKAVVAEIMGM